MRALSKEHSTCISPRAWPKGHGRLCRPALEADPLLVDLLFDVGDGFAGVQAFGTRLGAVHDGHAAVQLYASQTVRAVNRRACVRVIGDGCVCAVWSVCADDRERSHASHAASEQQ